MSTSTDRQRRALLLPLGLLMLSISVFGFGLQYKLSLYQNESSTQPRTAEAKLLSQKERPVAAQAPSRLAEAPIWQPVLFVALSFAAFQLVRRYRRLQSLQIERPPRPSCYRFIFVRPPPFAALSF